MKTPFRRRTPAPRRTPAGQTLYADSPVMKGWHRGGRAPRKILAVLREQDPSLRAHPGPRTVVDDAGNETVLHADQPQMRVDRAAFLAARRARRARGQRPFSEVEGDVLRIIDHKVLSPSVLARMPALPDVPHGHVMIVGDDDDQHGGHVMVDQ